MRVAHQLKIKILLCALALGVATHAHAEDVQLSDYQAVRLACFQHDGDGNMLDEGYLFVADQIDVVPNPVLSPELADKIINGTTFFSYDKISGDLPFKVNVYPLSTGTPFSKEAAELIIVESQTVAVPELEIEESGLFGFGEQYKSMFYVIRRHATDAEIRLHVLLSSSKKGSPLEGSIHNVDIDWYVFVVCLPFYTVSFEETHRRAPEAVKEYQRTKDAR